MKLIDFNEVQIEAIEVADAYTNNCLLPTYSALLSALHEICKNDPYKVSSAGNIARRALEQVTVKE